MFVSALSSSELHMHRTCSLCGCVSSASLAHIIQGPQPAWLTSNIHPLNVRVQQTGQTLVCFITVAPSAVSA